MKSSDFVLTAPLEKDKESDESVGFDEEDPNNYDFDSDDDDDDYKKEEKTQDQSVNIRRSSSLNRIIMSKDNK